MSHRAVEISGEIAAFAEDVDPSTSRIYRERLAEYIFTRGSDRIEESIPTLATEDGYLESSLRANRHPKVRGFMAREGQIVKLLSLNVSKPHLMVYKGATINTGIFKKAVTGRVMLRTLNLDGDRQADLSVHGGPYKAVYGYPSEHYAYWRQELPDAKLPWGGFGENFTTEGMEEEDLHIGDRFRIGSASVMVRQPRMPCYKLAAKFQRDDMIEQFLRSGRSGFYFSVDREGEVGEGDLLEPISQEREGITIAEMNRLFFREKYNRDLLQKAIATAALPEDWREYFLPRLDGQAGNV